MIAIAARISLDLRVGRQVLVYRGSAVKLGLGRGFWCFEAVLIQAAGPRGSQCESAGR